MNASSDSAFVTGIEFRWRGSEPATPAGRDPHIPVVRYWTTGAESTV